MAENSKIAWCDHTFNGWIGCARVVYANTKDSECDHCYAATVASHYKQAEWGVGKPRNRTSEKYWREPLKWDKRANKNGEPELVFCSSMADVFDGEVPDQWRFDLFELIRSTPSLIWLLLSKRDPRPFVKRFVSMFGEDAIPRNIWWGFSAGHQEALDGRYPWYRDLAERFLPYKPVIWVSAEPLLGPVDLSGVITGPHPISWFIAGGESGVGARLTREEWVDESFWLCAEYGVPVFMKQLGEVWAKNIGVKGKGDSYADIPFKFRLRQYPHEARHKEALWRS